MIFIETLLLSAGVGATIGYVTNALAIKMLFRPYTDKKVGNLTLIPKGVIPKEQPKLARNLGEIVDEHLLHNDELVKLINSDALKEEVSRTIESYVDAFMQREFESIESYVEDKEVLKRELSLSLDALVRSGLTPFIDSKESDQAVDGLLRTFLYKLSTLRLYDFGITPEMFDNTVQKWIENAIIEKREFIFSHVEAFLRSDFSLHRVVKLDEVTLHNIGREGVGYLQRLIMEKTRENKRAISVYLAEFLMTMIEKNFGAFVANFVKKESLESFVYENIEQYLHELLYKEAFENFMVSEAVKLFKSLLEMPLYDISMRFDHFALSKSLTDALLSVAMKKSFEFLLPFKEAILFTPLYNTKTRPFLTRFKKKAHTLIFEYMREEEKRKSISLKLSEASANLLITYKIGSLKGKVPTLLLTKVKEGLKAKAMRFLEDEAITLAEKLQVKETVIEKVERFSPERMENLLLILMKKHLKFINFAGAFLGALIGAVQAFIITSM